MVDNHYTGGKSSLEDLARMRSLKRHIAIAHKQGQENVKRSVNVNDAGDPSWEVSQRLNDRMAKTVAGYLSRSVFTNDDKEKNAADLVGEELTLARKSGQALYENALSAHRLQRHLQKRLGKYGDLQTSGATSDGSAVYWAGKAMASLFKKSSRGASEAKAKTPIGLSTPEGKEEKKVELSKNNPSDTSIGGMTQLTSALGSVPEKKKPVKNLIDFTSGDFMTTFALGLASDSKKTATLADLYAALPKAEQDLYAAGDLGKNPATYLTFLQKHKYSVKDKKGARPVSFSFGGAKGKAGSNLVEITLNQDGAPAAVVCVPMDETRMLYGEYGEVKVFPTASEKASYLDTLSSAVANAALAKQ